MRGDFGKPGVEMLETVLRMLGLSADRGVMLGDRRSTDIAMAAMVGMESALLPTGKTTPKMAGRLPQDGAPTCILNGIDDLLPATGKTPMVQRAGVRHDVERSGPGAERQPTRGAVYPAANGAPPSTADVVPMGRTAWLRGVTRLRFPARMPFWGAAATPG